jgi:hypothetical protein
MKGMFMNHQPFREWLLSEQELSPEQSRQLKDHLSSCEACSLIESSWKEIEGSIQNLPMAEPTAGFTDRWQAQLSEYSQIQQKRKGWLIISGTAVVVISLLGALVYQAWAVIQSPDTFMAVLFERLMGVVSIYFSFRNLIGEYSWPTPIITSIAMIFLVGILSFMSVLWLATYRKLSLARRRA